MELLRSSDADVIGLQEVTNPFLKHILAEPWVRANYYCSENGAYVPFLQQLHQICSITVGACICVRLRVFVEAGTYLRVGLTVRAPSSASATVAGVTGEKHAASGQIVLCRFPFATRLHFFSARKHVVIAEASIAVPAGAASAAGRSESRQSHATSDTAQSRLLVAVLHLTSDHHSGMQRRVDQMRSLYDCLDKLAGPSSSAAATAAGSNGAVQSPSSNGASTTSMLPVDTVIIGDFNFGDGDEGEEFLLRSDQYVDVWPALRPSEAGYTFDPETNCIAAVSGIDDLLTMMFVDSH